MFRLFRSDFPKFRLLSGISAKTDSLGDVEEELANVFACRPSDFLFQACVTKFRWFFWSSIVRYGLDTVYDVIYPDIFGRYDDTI